MIVKRGYFIVQQYGEDGWVRLKEWDDNPFFNIAQALAFRDTERSKLPGPAQHLIRLVHRQTFTEEIH